MALAAERLTKPAAAPDHAGHLTDKAPDPIEPSTALAPADPMETPPEPKPSPIRGPQRPGLDHAFDFGELGVWGLDRRFGNEAPPRTCGVEPDPGKPVIRAPRAEAVALAPGAQQHPRTPLELEAHPETPATRPVPDRPGHQGGVLPGRPTPITSRQDSVVAETRPGPEDLEAAESAAEAPVPGESAPAPAENATPVNVTVLEAEGGVQVAAVLAHINPDTVGRLRRLAQALARELGLSLAGFSMNGVSVETPANPDRSSQWR